MHANVTIMLKMPRPSYTYLNRKFILNVAIKTWLLWKKSVSDHQDLQIFVFQLNKYMCNFQQLE